MEYSLNDEKRQRKRQMQWKYSRMSIIRTNYQQLNWQDMIHFRDSNIGIFRHIRISEIESPDN